MLIDSVVQKEAVRNEQMILQYESLIEALPKGSIACRKTDTTILDTERTASCTINILVKILTRLTQSVKSLPFGSIILKCFLR